MNCAHSSGVVINFFANGMRSFPDRARSLLFDEVRASVPTAPGYACTNESDGFNDANFCHRCRGQWISRSMESITRLHHEVIVSWPSVRSITDRVVIF